MRSERLGIASRMAGLGKPDLGTLPKDGGGDVASGLADRLMQWARLQPPWESQPAL